ncbi:putative lipoprotein, partial [Vibrio harveyi]
TLYPD